MGVISESDTGFGTNDINVAWKKYTLFCSITHLGKNKQNFSLIVKIINYVPSNKANTKNKVTQGNIINRFETISFRNVE